MDWNRHLWDILLYRSGKICMDITHIHLSSLNESQWNSHTRQAGFRKVGR